MSGNISSGQTHTYTHVHTYMVLQSQAQGKTIYPQILKVALDSSFQLNDRHQPKINNAK